MKPRPVENGYLTKAIEFEQRLDRLEKAKCDCGKEPCKCKNCPKCGSKMNKMGGCMKADCGTKMAKAAIENPKPLPKENSKIEQLGSRLNPHEGTGAEREDTAGEKKNLKKSSKAEMRERNVPMLCGTCGGSKDSGCKGPMPGTDILACPAFKPL